jgi:uncharacterized protein (DUF2336 family)
MHHSKLEDLIELAREPSSERRRELLREVTDLFFQGAQGYGLVELDLFDGVMTQLVTDMESEVRAELASRLADIDPGPQRLLRRLAGDEIAVAKPLLTRSPALSDSDLIEVARSRGQDHLRAISERRPLPEAVSDVIVERGDDETLGVLLRNDDAALSRWAAETVVDRATGNPALHEAVVERKRLPIDLLNEMYFIVEHRLRERILQKNAEIDPKTLEEALRAGRTRIATQDGALPSGYEEAVEDVQALKAKGGLTGQALAGMLRAGERTRFLAALAELTELDFTTVRRIVDRRELDAMAVACKASGMDRSLFLTMAILILDPGEAMGRAQEYGRLYQELPVETAARTMRFWRVRRETADFAAA